MTERGVRLLLALLAVAWFGTLGVRPLYKADESRYAEIPREMLASGDWITPRLNGFKYFEKPPLQYWTTAAFFTLFEVADWSARLWTALAGFAGIFMVLFVGRRLFGAPAGLYAAAVLAGSPLYVMLGQINTLDMGLTFFLCCAVFAFALGHMFLFWAACALAVLSKGLIGIVLPIGTIALYVLIKRDWGLLGKMRIFPGVALFLAIAAPWFIAVSLANDEFLRFFFIQEHFQRFATEMHGRAHPAWYFLPVLAAGMAPWLLPLGFALFHSVKNKAERFDAVLFLALWALVVFAFFSASGSKLPSYILPVFPPLALLIGRWLAAFAARRVLIAQCALLAVAGLALAVLAPRLAASYASYIPWLVAAGIWLAVTSVAAWRRSIAACVGLLALGGFGATQIALIGHRTLAAEFSAAPTVAALPISPPAAASLFAVEAYDHSVAWSLRRTLTMVGYKDELGEAIRWEPQKFIPDLPGFARAWSAAPEAYAFFAARDFDRLRAELALPMQVAARGPRYVIVRKP
ncbi:MAG: glycosyltransferase family 39 protein [Betaproteobacteria bacterium]|nr:MAG: glycosyltransferase family 39 protein [Betaproteobacteria bacterium]